MSHKPLTLLTILESVNVTVTIFIFLTCQMCVCITSCVQSVILQSIIWVCSLLKQCLYALVLGCYSPVLFTLMPVPRNSFQEMALEEISTCSCPWTSSWHTSIIFLSSSHRQSPILLRVHAWVHNYLLQLNWQMNMGIKWATAIS